MVVISFHQTRDCLVGVWKDCWVGQVTTAGWRGFVSLRTQPYPAFHDCWLEAGDLARKALRDAGTNAGVVGEGEG